MYQLWGKTINNIFSAIFSYNLPSTATKSSSDINYKENQLFPYVLMESISKTSCEEAETLAPKSY